MKKLILLVFTGFVLVSCQYTTGSGNIVSENRAVAGFDGISVDGGFDVEVKTGATPAVVVEADDNIIKYIETEVSGSTLKIRTKRNRSLNNVHMKVYITASTLRYLSASASANVEVQDMFRNPNKISFRASSGASINAEIDTPEAEAVASSGATISLEGKTRNYKAEASSGSEIRSRDLLSENTRVKASSGSSVSVHASVTLSIRASSGSDVDYYGAASLTNNVSSGASVSKKD